MEYVVNVQHIFRDNKDFQTAQQSIIIEECKKNQVSQTIRSEVRLGQGVCDTHEYGDTSGW